MLVTTREDEALLVTMICCVLINTAVALIETDRHAPDGHTMMTLERLPNIQNFHIIKHS